MAVIFGREGTIILPWTVRGDHFRGGLVHGVTGLPYTSPHSGTPLIWTPFGL